MGYGVWGIIMMIIMMTIMMTIVMMTKTRSDGLLGWLGCLPGRRLGLMARWAAWVACQDEA